MVFQKVDPRKVEVFICPVCEEAYGDYILITHCDKCTTPVYEMMEIYCDANYMHVCEACIEREGWLRWA